MYHGNGNGNGNGNIGMGIGMISSCICSQQNPHHVLCQELSKQV